MTARIRVFIFTSLLFHCVVGSAHALTDKGFKKLHIFTSVLHYIEENYVEPVDEEAVISGAIQGMVSVLDPHSVYMSPEVYKELKIDTRGRFDGIGIEVTIRDSVLTVVSPIKGSPADRQGIRAGDRIRKINNKSTEGMSLTEAVKAMRGRRGSEIHLSIERSDPAQVFEVVLVRQAIHVPSVKAEMLNNDYGYVNITSFQEHTTSSLEKEIKRLEKQTSLKGLILDLRHNPGGLLEEAVGVADFFLEDGVIVSTSSRGREIDRRMATSSGREPKYPIVVLVDGGSASASEIVAGALQDQKRATIMGQRSFGKGSVQTVVDLDDGSGLKLTIAKYFTPSGRSIHGLGIAPNIVVPAKRPSAKEAEESSEKEDYQKLMALEHLERASQQDDHKSGRRNRK